MVWNENAKRARAARSDKRAGVMDVLDLKSSNAMWSAGWTDPLSLRCEVRAERVFEEASIALLRVSFITRCEMNTPAVEYVFHLRREEFIIIIFACEICAAGCGW